MSIFISHRDMSANDLMKCSYQAQAIIRLCSLVANDPAGTGSDIGDALVVALEMVGVMHDALETHEGLKGGEAS